MATRGLFGFRKNGEDKAVYNHYDSYPDVLGEKFVSFLKRNIDSIDAIYEKITPIDPTEKPTNKQKTYCKKMGWYNSNVSNMNDDDWYCLLRGLQNLNEWQAAINNDAEEIYIENYINFIRDSLFCEYAYIYDLDAEVLEVYHGFQKIPDESSLYGSKASEEGYYPCKLICTFSKEEIQKKELDWFVWKMRKAVNKDRNEHEKKYAHSKE